MLPSRRLDTADDSETAKIQHAENQNLSHDQTKEKPATDEDSSARDELEREGSGRR